MNEYFSTDGGVLHLDKDEIERFCKIETVVDRHKKIKDPNAAALIVHTLRDSLSIVLDLEVLLAEKDGQGVPIELPFSQENKDKKSFSLRKLSGLIESFCYFDVPELKVDNNIYMHLIELIPKYELAFFERMGCQHEEALDLEVLFVAGMDVLEGLMALNFDNYTTEKIFNSEKNKLNPNKKLRSKDLLKRIREEGRENIELQKEFTAKLKMPLYRKPIAYERAG